MKIFNIKILLPILVVLLITTISMNAQQGTVTVNQSPEIDKLLELKKDIRIEEERYRISIFSGSRFRAEAAQLNFKKSFPQYPSIMEYETPNYKIYIGNFRSRLEADRALPKIKKKFIRAFIL